MAKNQNPTRWKILLVDDEQDIRDITQLTLESDGYQVTTAENGNAGLALCRSYLPQIVITDIRMPEMDGLQLLEAIKQEYPDMEVIVVTAFGEMDLAIRALQLDASDFVTKPIDVTALRLALDRAKHRYTTRKRLADYTALLEREHARTSEELVRTFHFQKNLIENAMDGILGCDGEETIVMFNRSIEALTRYCRDEVIRRKQLSDFFSEESKQAMDEAFDSEKHGGKNRLYLYESAILSRDGTSIPVQISAIQLYDNGQESGKVFFFRDLQEIRKLEQEKADQARILHQDKMMSLGRLAASVVHEINNPLSGILNYLRLMLKILDRGSPDAQQLEKFKTYTRLVETETARCANIVSSLLTFSRKSEPRFEPVDMHQLLQRCVVLSQHRLELSNIALEVSSEPDMPLILGDANQLQQAIINLIFNAIDAMPQGGTLRLKAIHDASSKSVDIQVEDTGIGISKSHLKQIFEPFFTTKQEGYGVGLGLSTVYGIIQRHNGTIEVESEIGKGTRFTLRFPITPIAPSPHQLPGAS